MHMWNGKRKALTFSYDDGIEQDIRLAGLFDHYGLKCTFNLNSGINENGETWDYKGIKVRRAGLSGLVKPFARHEVAAHSVSHPNLADLPHEQMLYEIRQDIADLESTFGVRIHGMAYPFGGYNDTVIQTLANCGLRYARTADSSHAFNLPAHTFRLQPTCHHNDYRMGELADLFLNTKPGDGFPMLFYIWGHSYEFDADDNWRMLEMLCEKLAGRDDVFYGTNAEVLGLK